MVTCQEPGLLWWCKVEAQEQAQKDNGRETEEDGKMEKGNPVVVAALNQSAPALGLESQVEKHKTPFACTRQSQIRTRMGGSSKRKEKERKYIATRDDEDQAIIN